MLEQVIQSASSNLKRAAATAALLQAHLYELPPATPHDRLPGSIRLPQGLLPPLAGALGDQDGLEAARRKAEPALGSLPMPPCTRDSSSLQALRLQISSLQVWQGADSEVARLKRLASIEEAVWSRMVQLQGSGGGSVSVKLPLSLAEVEALSKVVDEYWRDLHLLLGSDVTEVHMRVELQSRGVLTVSGMQAARWLAAGRLCSERSFQCLDRCLCVEKGYQQFETCAATIAQCVNVISHNKRPL